MMEFSAAHFSSWLRFHGNRRKVNHIPQLWLSTFGCVLPADQTNEVLHLCCCQGDHSHGIWALVRRRHRQKDVDLLGRHSSTDLRAPTRNILTSPDLTDKWPTRSTLTSPYILTARWPTKSILTAIDSTATETNSVLIQNIHHIYNTIQ